jgi:hypothetical protein
LCLSLRYLSFEQFLRCLRSDSVLEVFRRFDDRVVEVNRT